MNWFTADIGKRKLHVYDSGNDKFYGKLPQDILINLNIPGLKRGDVLVAECAHLRESHKLTMAQPFNYKQLEELKRTADEKGVTILVFPQKSTPKARKLSGTADDKSDEVDTRAIASFLLNDKNAFNALKQFVPKELKNFKEENKSIVEYIRQSNDDINEAKGCEYGLTSKFEDIYQDEVSKWIKKYTVDGGSSIFGYQPTIADYLNYDEELLSLVGTPYNKKTGQLRIENGNRIYTLVHSILRPNGELRVRIDVAKVPHWKYIKAHYLGCKPYHMKQGVAASNYKHWMRRAASEYAFPEKDSANSTDFQVGMSYDEYAKLKKARTKVDKMTQKIWCALRKMIVEDGLR
jgi:hypothetical protein